MTLPLTDMTIFIYSFYGLVAVSLLITKSINIAIEGLKKAHDHV